MNKLSFKEALEYADYKKNKPTLLLGNGFSIAFEKSIFSYTSLFENARKNHLFNGAQRVLKLFDRTKIYNFESSMKLLKTLMLIFNLYVTEQQSEKIKIQITKDIEHLKNIIIKSILMSHPNDADALSEQQYDYCAHFLHFFGFIYTLNYDLLLYWVVVRRLRNEFKDGFQDPVGLKLGKEKNYVCWLPTYQSFTNLFYLHGGLHLYDAGYEIRKCCWSKQSISLKDQIIDNFLHNKLPLFVAEGTALEKLEVINHNAYLSAAFNSLSACSGSLFLHGLSFNEADHHILAAIAQSKVEKIFVSLYSEQPETIEKKDWALKQLVHLRQTKQAYSPETIPSLEIFYYDAASANIWGNTVQKTETYA